MLYMAGFIVCFIAETTRRTTNTENTHRRKKKKQKKQKTNKKQNFCFEFFERPPTDPT